VFKGGYGMFRGGYRVFRGGYRVFGEGRAGERMVVQIMDWLIVL